MNQFFIRIENDQFDAKGKILSGGHLPFYLKFDLNSDIRGGELKNARVAE
jgi:hypothetical protein